MLLLEPSQWVVKNTKTKGRGVFAREIIHPGTVIGDYLGRILPVAQDPDGEDIYSMTLGDHVVVAPEVASVGLHLINHSCMPNCGMYPYKGHMLYVALRKIFVGEELTVQYMVHITQEAHQPLLDCHCGSPFCHGTMYISQEKDKKFITFLKRKQGKQYNMSLPFGSTLLRLERYPLRVEDDKIYDLFGSLSKKPYIYAASTLPTIDEIRQLIRTTGLQIQCKKLHATIVGILDGHVAYSPL